MSHWKALPNGLEPPARQFVTELRMLKDSGGLSLATLARRTSYSKSSWERYLNGKNLPPAEAVVEIARLGGADIDRLLALRSLAEECWQAGPGSAANGTEPTTATTGGDGREGDGGSGGDGVGSATGVDGSGAGVPDAEHPDAERPD
ncbi:helix-turn-helix domain-containing protein, partial [Streptomyces sparsus]